MPQTGFRTRNDLSEPFPMNHLPRRTALAVLAAFLLHTAAFNEARAADTPADPPAKPAKLTFQKGDRVVFMGGTFAEREAHFGYIETLLQARFPDLGLTFRNLGYSADTAHSLLGDITRGDGDDNRQSNRALNFGTMHKHLGDVKADVIFLCLGMADSFAGEAGLEQFAKDLQALLKAYGSRKYNGKSPPRIVLVGPIAHEKLGGEFPDPTEHNKQSKPYSEAMRKIAEEKQLPFIDLFTPTETLMKEKDGDKLTFNGIHLTQYGYWAVAQRFLSEDLGRIGSPSVIMTWPGSPDVRTIEKAFHEFYLGKLPVPPPPNGAKVHGSIGYSLGVCVRRLPQGRHVLRINGQAATIGTAKEWGNEDDALQSGVPLLSSPPQEAAETMRLAIVERNQHFFSKWRAVNGEYIYGRRAQPFGVVNFPGEMKMLDELCQELDRKIHKLNQVPKITSVELVPLPKGQPEPSLRRKHEVPPLPSVAEIYHQKQGYMPNGQRFPTAADPEEERKTFKLAEGYEINLFASEKDFPLHNPLAMAWDTKGRLWVTTMPTYPHALPGVAPNDKILILEDTKGAGKADKCTVFADRLYLPTAIEFGHGGVYVGAQPNLLFLKDTNGDDVADERHVILHGFGSGDSHHAIHTFTWSPEGALHFQEGIFHRTNVETPWGVVRQHDAGIYRFEPRRHKLEVYVSYNFANPWGHVFDRWGQNFIADASGGANYFALPLTGHVEYPRQHENMKVFTSVVRPTCGCEIVSSRHFPPQAQGNFLVNNDIGFQGIKRHKIIEEGSGFTSTELEPLLVSTDRNFRPVDLKFGPDGALYVVDWFNPLIGHMQHSIRDPGRDHYHGRIWRITYKGRDLVKAPKIHGEPIPKLLDLFKTYEDRTRSRVRMELRERKAEDVLPALDKWVRGFDPKDALYEHNLLEALWVTQSMGSTRRVANALLQWFELLIDAKDYHAQAAVTRALRHARELPEVLVLELLEGQVNHKHPRVRLEAVVALSFFKNAKAAEIALQALKQPTDYYLDYALKETITTLEPYWRPAVTSGNRFAADNPAGASYIIGKLSTAELARVARSGPVYAALLSREGVLPAQRKEALAGLAKLNKTDELTELFAAIERIDQGTGHHGAHVLSDLAQLLTERKADDLARARPRLEQLATKARQPITRQVAYVMLMTADHAVDRPWQLGTKSAESLHDLLEAVPLLPDAKLRAATYPQVKLLVHALPDHLAAQAKANKGVRGRDVRRAAVAALAAIPGQEAEAFTTLARLVREDADLRDAAVAALRRIPWAAWPRDQVRPLLDTLVSRVATVPAAERDQPAVLDALQLGNDLASLLPPAEAKQVRARLGALGVNVVLVRTVPHKMVYDRTRFYVEAGKPVVVVLENADIMPHNLVLCRPGSLTEVGMAADVMATDPNAFQRQFVPGSSKVLHHTRLLQPQEVERLRFIAPKQPGEYPYVCTFPGHWRVMYGTMYVVPRLADVALEDLQPLAVAEGETRPFVRNWTFADLAGDLEQIGKGRSFERGKALFTAASCIQCHKIQKEGGIVGPDLAEIPQKLADKTKKYTLADLLQDILEPSKVINEKYQSYIIVTGKGELVTGVIVADDGKKLTVATNPLAKPVEIAADDIDSKEPAKVSMMPQGLLVTLSREEILDLLAYVAAGGDPQHPAFRRRE
jgi:putative heme-binding domain-containing protein